MAVVVGFSTFQTECANSKYKFKFTYNRCKYKFKFKYDRQTYNFQPDNSKFKSVDSLQPFPFIYIYITIETKNLCITLATSRTVSWSIVIVSYMYISSDVVTLYYRYLVEQ